MALSGFSHGGTLVAAAKVNTNDWNSTNTGVALGSGDGVEVRLDGGFPKAKVDWDDNEAAPGTVAIRRPGEIRHITVEGPITMNAAFSGPQRVVANFFGTDTATLLGSGAYEHALVIDDSPTQVYNFGWTDTLRLHDIPHCKTESLTFTYEEGKIGTIEAMVLGKRLYVGDDAANTLANVNANVTLPTQPTTLYAMNTNAGMTVRMNAQSGGALASGDRVYPSKVVVKYTRKYGRRFARNVPYIDEPVAGDWIEVTVTLSFPIDARAADFTDLLAGTAKKMDIDLVGATIGGGFTWRQFHQFPYLEPRTDGLPEVSGPDLLTIDLSYVAKYARANPTGMAFDRARLIWQDTTATSHLV